jgi:hypothetical protein
LNPPPDIFYWYLLTPKGFELSIWDVFHRILAPSSVRLAELVTALRLRRSLFGVGGSNPSPGRRVWAYGTGKISVLIKHANVDPVVISLL